jgi:hypothetical protein
VHEAVVTVAQKHEVPETGLATIGPVLDVVPFGEPETAARETAAAIAGLEGAAHVGGNGAGPPPHAEDVAVRVVRHPDYARVAGNPP